MGFFSKIRKSIKSKEEKSVSENSKDNNIPDGLIVTMEDIENSLENGEFEDFKLNYDEDRGVISFNYSKNFSYLENLINSQDNEISLDNDIVFEEGVDHSSKININRDNLIIDGNNNNIDCNNSLISFECSGKGIIFKNIKFLNSTGLSIIQNTSSGELKFINCEFIKNQSILGGAIFNKGKIDFENCNFKNNFAQGGGGAIHNEPNSALKISNCNFYKNYSVKGTAISNFGNISLSNCEFLENTGGTTNESENSQGTIQNDDTGIIKIYKCIFKSNIAELGAVLFNLGRASLSDSLFEDNNAKFGIINNNPGGVIKMNGCHFENNDALQFGGAIMNFSECAIRNSDFFKNRAGIRGGAIACQIGGKLSYDNCNFKENSPDNVFDPNQ